MRRFFFCALCLLLFLGCGIPAANAPVEHDATAMETGLVNVIAIAQDPAGFLVPVTRRVPAGTELTGQALALLTASVQNQSALARLGLVPPLPDGVTFRVTAEDAKTAVVDVCGLPELGGREAELAAVTAIVNTAAAGNISRVRLLFDGEERQALPHGTEVSGLRAAFPLNPEPLPTVSGGDDLYPLTLYYPNPSRSALLPVTRYQKSQPPLAAAIGALIQNAADTSLPACYPEGTLLEYVHLLDGVATLSFTGAFDTLSDDPLQLRQAIACILLTCGEYDAVKKVKLQIEGAPYGAESYAPPEAVNALY